jgi:NADH:ubiquinone oxidoreductase subunit F (NADH-binding)
VVGEETALVSLLNGGLAKPPGRGPKPFEEGVDRRPTLVLNAETVCHLAYIFQEGPERFRSVGTPEHPGTSLATIGGAVAQPGVVEAPLGTRLVDLARMAGGTTARPKGVLIGGYYGAWLDARTCAGVGWSDEELTPWGARVGCGAVAFLPEDACAVDEVARVLTWMAGQSAGQCGPCVHGLGAIADAATDLAEGRGGPDTVEWLHRWASQVEGRGGCRFPDGAVRFLRTALDVFADDVERHRLGHACSPPADGRHWLPIPDNGSAPWI